MTRLPLLSLLLLAACTGSPPPELDLDASAGADLVLLHGRVATFDSAQPDATALAVRGDRIVAVGSDAEIMRHVTERTRRIDLHGRYAQPGFVEGHGHFLGLGAQKLELDLRGAQSWEEIVALVGAAAQTARKGEWIRGRGWHQAKWSHAPIPSLDGLPFHDELSRVSPENPVLLEHASGHAAFVNERALALAGIGAETANPEGGEIVRGADGRPTGMLRETAQALVARLAARGARDTFRKQVELATETCLAHGVTSFQDAGEPLATIDRLRALADHGELGVRLFVMARDDHASLRAGLAARRVIGAGGGFFTMRCIKEAIDGAVGSHGAWFLAPYSDMPSTSGLNTTSLADIEEAAMLAREHDLQLAVHAIGDRANRETLDVYERVLGPSARTLDHRWRIEHAQHLDVADVPRFGALGVIASMQGVHCTSDGPWIAHYIGDERARSGAYVWRSLLDSGAVVSNGTDTPVEDVDPLACLAASVTRRLPDGRAFFPEQRMTRAEALRSYTLAAAFAAHEDDVKGSLTPGKYADVVVLDRDLRTCADDEIATARVLYTIVGGRVAYEAP